jgi:3-hydroxy-9,10-secoandrosta-1,3,5(10)-triene-9,17-dione monooxygenase reductase component
MTVNPTPRPSGLDSDTYRSVLGHFCSGVVIVTSGEGDTPIGMTVQSFTSLSLDPPLVLFCPAVTSTTWPRVRDTGKFCINVLGHHHEYLCRQFAVSGGDKFGAAPWQWSSNGNPVIDGCLSYIECTLEAVHDAGDHHIAVGRVPGLRLGDSQRPLLFFRGSFRQLHEEPAAVENALRER